MTVENELKIEQDGEILTKKFEYRKIKYFILVKEIPSGNRFILLQYLIRDDFTSKCIELFYTLMNEFDIDTSIEKGSFLWIYRTLSEEIYSSLDDVINSLEAIATEQIDFFYSIKNNIDILLKKKLKKLKNIVQEFKNIVK